MDQSANTPSEPNKPDSVRNALVSAVAQQIIICLVAMVMLDGGVTLLKCIYALVAFWVGFAILLVRRRRRLEKRDFAFIRYGYLALCACSFFLAPLVWALRGVHA
jgi:hypothetical protein